MNQPAETERGIYMPVQVYPMFETAFGPRPADRVEEHLERHSASCGPASAHVAADNPYAWIRDAKSAEEITHGHAEQPDDRLPVPEVHELEQRRRHGARRSSCARSRRLAALGVPEDRWVFPHVGSRLPRAHVRVPPRHVRPHAGDRARWHGGARARRASASTTSASSTSTRASRRRCSSARPSLGVDLDRQLVAHRRAAVRRRAVEQLRHARHRRRSSTTCASSPASTAWSGPTAATPRSMRSACTRPSRRPPGSATTEPQDEIDRLPRRELARPPTPRAGDDRGVHGDVRARRRTRTAHRVVPARRRSAGLGDVDRRRHRRRDVRRGTRSAPSSPSPPTARST